MLSPFIVAAAPFVALPMPRFVVRSLGCTHLYHYTRIENLRAIMPNPARHEGDWALGEVDIQANSGFTGGRWLRDYSLFDFELRLRERGTYTYFFGREPTWWGRRKNLNISGDQTAAEQGLGVVRVGLEVLLGLYDGPLFCRADDQAVVIRGAYRGPGAIMPGTHRVG